MKKHITKFSISVIILFIFTIICAGVLAFLSYQQIIPYHLNKIIMTALSLILFFIFGLIFGGISKKRGLLSGIGLSLLYLLGVSLYLVIGHHQWDLITSLRIGLRMLSLITGTIIGVNLSSRSS